MSFLKWKKGIWGVQTPQICSQSQNYTRNYAKIDRSANFDTIKIQKILVSHMKWGYLQVALGLHYSQKKFQAILRSWIFDPPPSQPPKQVFFLWGVADDIKEIFQGGSIFLA